jgi:hypothetical protein
MIFWALKNQQLRTRSRRRTVNWHSRCTPTKIKRRVQRRRSRKLAKRMAICPTPKSENITTCSVLSRELSQAWVVALVGLILIQTKFSDRCFRDKALMNYSEACKVVACAWEA